MRLLAALLLWLAAALPAAAQTLVVSEKADRVAVTLYRDPYRGKGAIPPDWPGGYALITETRSVALPAGRSVLRFAGVSQGMMPESAIVTGLPRGVIEKNRDARLLSPAALVDAYLKRRVTLTRTDRKTGRKRVQEAVIEAGPTGGVLVTTADGVEALACSGLAERLTYPGVPADLSAKPTLSVIVDSASATRVTVELSYLAQGFDWAANYVARVAPDGRTLDLFAWLTVANGGSQGFADAATQAVAGGLHREAAAALPAGPSPRLDLRCWLMDITSTHAKIVFEKLPWPEDMDERAGEDVVVTGSRVRRRGLKLYEAAPMAMPPPPAPPPPPVAVQEELGDLKLYRLPEPVTIAAKSRKQVTMIDRRNVPFETFYVATFDGMLYGENGLRPDRAAMMTLRAANETASGLGLPLPAGRVAVFERARGLLLGESDLADRAAGEELEIAVGDSTDVRYALTALPSKDRARTFTATVSNARATPATFELLLPLRPAEVDADAALIERKGRQAWRVTVPANASATLHFTIRWP